MIRRFDHAVIAARDLEQAKQLYGETLGFAVYPGGRHTGLGTENAIVRFGLDYLELIGVYDRAEVAAAGIKRSSLLEFLEARPGGMLGYCLATDDIDALAAQFERTGLDALGPYEMQRLRPDGVLLRWRLLVPGGTAWRRPWPFFIQWEMEDDARLQLEQPGQHPNGATAVTGLSVVVKNLQAAHHLYAVQLGLPLVDEGEQASAAYARYAVGDFAIDLLQPLPDSPAQNFLDAHGEGLYKVALRVQKPGKTAQYLQTHGAASTHTGNAVALDATTALGAELVFVAP